ncbi:MAG TPA: fatty acid desaturase [Polyangiaceae bacterium]|nr:fatty acid desaturase [Polyangiaceae bacterium]
MKIWKHTPMDAALLALSVGQWGATWWLAATWDASSVLARALGFALLVAMMTYNIIIVSHLFTHAAWFEARWLNALVSTLNSINIGQSVEAYRLSHVRNHHRYNNDQKGVDGKTKDRSSTYQDGKGEEHATLFRYAVIGALSTVIKVGGILLAIGRAWRVGPHERDLLEYATKVPATRARELRQVQRDRIAHAWGVCFFLIVSWKWTLICYLPAYFLALTLVNVQNYYEHYGAAPSSRYTDSVSHYGRLYNLLSFNDGYHQEHHLRPQTHWSCMPKVRHVHEKQLDSVMRTISPVPAILGFFDRRRKLLHLRAGATIGVGVVHDRDD